MIPPHEITLHQDGSQTAALIPSPTDADPFARARALAQASGHFAQASVACQVMCGLELLGLKKSLGITQGKRTDKADGGELLPRGRSWDEMVKAETGLAINTARRWMEMAAAAVPRLKKNGLSDVELMSPANWDEETTERVDKVLHKLTDGQSQMDFLRELGIAKLPKAINGGKKTKGESSEPNPDEPPPGWNPADWVRYLNLPGEQRAAVDIWKPTMDFLAVALLDKNFAELPERERAELAQLLGDLRSGLGDITAKAAKSKRKEGK